ncbi:MAG: hypothetical protein ACI9LO_001350 [Planctomycetota bacterium]|jgi:hypothetical protein
MTNNWKQEMTNLIAYFRLSLVLIVGISLIALMLPGVSLAANDWPADKWVITKLPNVTSPINRNYPAGAGVNLDSNWRDGALSDAVDLRTAGNGPGGRKAPVALIASSLTVNLPAWL